MLIVVLVCSLRCSSAQCWVCADLVCSSLDSLLCWSACYAACSLMLLIIAPISFPWSCLGIWSIVDALNVHIFYTTCAAKSDITTCMSCQSHIHMYTCTYTLIISLAWVRGRPTMYPCPLGRRGRLATPLTPSMPGHHGGGVIGVLPCPSYVSTTANSGWCTDMKGLQKGRLGRGDWAAIDFEFEIFCVRLSYC